MRVLTVRNVQAALPAGLELLRDFGVDAESRNGPVRVAPFPVSTVYHNPRERVLFWRLRDANPFFHLFEALWMLDGRNDVAFVARFARQIAAYSDDGVTLHGAYGKRWRAWFGIDQLKQVVELLKVDPTSRRAVVQMWDAKADLGRGSKDLPCNTHIYPSINPLTGELDLTVCCRSNDMIWGAYGANAVHFSILQEYLATWIGVSVGHLTQVSNNYHAYSDLYTKLLPIADAAPDPYRTVSLCPYETGAVRPFPLIQEPVRFDIELRAFLDSLSADGEPFIPEEPFLKYTALPMWRAHRELKDRTTERWRFRAVDFCESIAASDWRHACRDWMRRRIDEWERKNAPQGG